MNARAARYTDGPATRTIPSRSRILTRDTASLFSPPETIGPYRVLHQVGAGVLGPVFRALDPDRERMVGIKLFRLDIPPEQASLLAEHLSTLVRSLPQHDALVPLLGAGIEGGSAYVVMDYIAADSVDQRLRRKVAAPLDQALPLLTQVADGLDAAARAGYHHGALHPRDILVSTRGAVCVTGVGVVQALESAGWKPPFRRPYAAPERLAGRPWDGRADVFSLGVLALEIATGRRPLMPENAAALQWLGVGDQSRTAAVRAALGSALAEDPTQRDASARTWIGRLALSVVGDEAESPRDTGELDLAGVEPGGEGPETEASDAEAVTLHEFPSEQSLSREAEIAVPELPLGPGVEEPAASEPEPLPSPTPEPQDASPEIPGVASMTAEADMAAELVLPAARGIEAEPLPIDVPLQRSEEPASDEKVELAHAAAVAQESTPFVVPSDMPPVASTEPPPPSPADHAPPPSAPTEEESGAYRVVAAEPPMPAGDGARATGAPRDSSPTWSALGEPATESPGGFRRWWLPVLALALVAAFAFGFGAGSWWKARSPRSASAPAPPTAASTAVPEPVSEEPVRTPGAPSTGGTSSRGVLEGPRSPASGTTAPREPKATGSAPPRAAADLKGRLSVRTTPRGAEVRINGTRRGRTPLTVSDLEYGTYRVAVSAPGRIPVEREVTISKKAASLAITLERAPATATRPSATGAAPAPAPIPGRPATLEVETRPSGATVYVDGARVGTSPLKLESFKPGRHDIRLELPGHRPWTTTITAVAGRPTRVTASLELSPEP